MPVVVVVGPAKAHGHQRGLQLETAVAGNGAQRILASGAANRGDDLGVRFGDSRVSVDQIFRLVRDVSLLRRPGSQRGPGPRWRPAGTQPRNPGLPRAAP